jgi:hypothetical protein
LVLLQGAAQRHRAALAGHAWPPGNGLRPHWQVCDTGHGAPAVLQALQDGWAAGLGQPGAADNSPSPPVAPVPSLEQLAQTPGVRAAALVDLSQGALLRPLGGVVDSAVEHVARSLCVARSMQRFALGPGAPVLGELLFTAQDQLQLLRPCREQPGQGVLLVLAPDTDLAPLRAGLAALDGPAYPTGGEPLAA